MCELIENVNDVTTLLSVSKGIYLMVARQPENYTDDAIFNQNNRLYRFGAIGINNGDNDAISRLSQANKGWRSEDICNFMTNNLKWSYKIIIKFDPQTEIDLLKNHEKALRKGFFQVDYQNNGNQFYRINRRDAFKTSIKPKDIQSIFIKILNTSFNYNF